MGEKPIPIESQHDAVRLSVADLMIALGTFCVQSGLEEYARAAFGESTDPNVIEARSVVIGGLMALGADQAVIESLQGGAFDTLSAVEVEQPEQGVNTRPRLVLVHSVSTADEGDAKALQSLPNRPATAPPQSAGVHVFTIDDVMDPNWERRAKCADLDPDMFFVVGAAQNLVKEKCNDCPVRTECLSVALDDRIQEGVYGGMTERQRRAAIRNAPADRNWRIYLGQAKADYMNRQASVGHQNPAT